MEYTAGQAAKAAGVSTATISRALKKGTLSGRKGPDGAWRIDPAELHRVYPMQAQPQADASPGETAALAAQLNAALDALADARSDRDHWRRMAERLALAPPEPERRSLWHRLTGR